MIQRAAIFCLFVLALFMPPALTAQAPASDTQLLWQIGTADNDMKEFALAPNKWKEYKKDPFYIIGRSQPLKDWTFCQPGPEDAWAGNRAHTASILFGIKNALPKGLCTLTIKLIDIGYSPVALTVSINGKNFSNNIPNGTGRSIHGDIPGGRPYAFNVSFPADLLTRGNNVITLTNEKGSWIVYDWIGLSGTTAIQQTAVVPSITISGTRSFPFLQTIAGKDYQAGQLSIVNTGNPEKISIAIKGRPAKTIDAASGQLTVPFQFPAVTKDSSLEILLQKNGKLIAAQTHLLHPVPKMTIYILPHSHNDIGYTEVQTKVEDKQINNLLTGIEYAKKTKNYPEGARFVWNLEGSYAADLYMHRLNGSQQKELADAVADGGVALNGMYLNTLTGLCRPEELLNLFKYTTTLSKAFNVKTDAAMISDVPGYTWGTVTAMAQAGIKYFSAAPNYFDRIGDILRQWEDKPFYWLSPSGKEKVLVWIPYKGYALSHGISHPSPDFVAGYLQHMQGIQYPYDISYIRWSGHGDNAVPDLEISDFVKDWNATYTWPHFIISSTSKAFHAFEDRYGSRLPQFSGDWTGYWEDGAGSSAFETAQNRATSSRLTQASVLSLITAHEGFPHQLFTDAWKNVLLYSEHTWGADCSVTDPLSQKTKEQWEIKKSYAATADSLSQVLLSAAATPDSKGPEGAIDVFNTSSWQRTDLALVPAKFPAKGDVIKDAAGTIIPSQRLSTGELAFLAKDVPAFGAKRFFISTGKSDRASAKNTAASPQTYPNHPVTALSYSLDNGLIAVSVDPHTGAISSLRNHSIQNNFADSSRGSNLNEYLFLKGDKLADLRHNGPVSVAIKENGSVLSTLSVSSTAPGCKKLVREITLIAGLDHVLITNILDKELAELNPHPGDYPWANTGGKEAVHIAYPFHVPTGRIRLDIPMAIIQPEKDQIPGSCKNWLETGSWADVSNDELGVTWATLDAPLVEIGEISATLLGGQSNPDSWRKKIVPTQTLYSWALNNHWETNYRAAQEGILIFRYALQPHTGYDPVAATKFATGLTQPLIITQSAGTPIAAQPLQLSSDKIIVLSFSSNADGAATLTLFNPGIQAEKTEIHLRDQTLKLYYSNTAQEMLAPLNGSVELAPQQLVTLRISR